MFQKQKVFLEKAALKLCSKLTGEHPCRNVISIKLFCNFNNVPEAKGVLRKSCSETMQQTYRRTPVPKCDFNKVVLQLYSNRALTWVFSCKFVAYFQNTFL